MLDVATLGQVFTPASIVQKMIGLLRNTGSILEPACGNGAFWDHLPPDRRTGLEIDASVALAHVEIGDFFNFDPNRTFDSIIGNPPFVRFQDIRPSTKAQLPMESFDRRTNLYVFFIWKALDHLAPGGELVFITPRDFLKATHAQHLNARLWREGAFTSWEDLGDARVFPGYGPTCAIWRFQKGRRSRRLDDGRVMQLNGNQLSFVSPQASIPLKDVFSVRVGAVSGADQLYTKDCERSVEFVCSTTHTHGITRKLLPDAPNADPLLRPHKDALLARRARRFGQKDWWRWVRNLPKTAQGPRLYVNGRTRREAPFFLHDCENWDGSILALFPHAHDLTLEVLRDRLNAIDWRAQGFMAGGRLLLTQRSLSHAILPHDFLRQP